MSGPSSPGRPLTHRPLLRILGISFGLAVMVGNTIGAGILRTPGDVAAWLPTTWIFLGIWIVGAAYAMLGSNALAELGAMLPRSGGQYIFARHAFGDYAGFVVGWNDWISTCASAAAISFVVGESVAALVPALSQHGPTVAIATVALFTMILLHGTRTGGRAQELTSLFKMLALAGFVGVCFVYGGGRAATAPAHGVAQTAASTSLFAGFVLAAQAVIYTYDGWTGPLYFSEEMRDPGREVPRAMFGGLLSVATIYILINIAYLYVLPVDAIAGSKLAAATVAETIFGARGDAVVRVVVLLALPSAVNACLLMSSRVLFAVSRDGLGPAVATRVNARGAPTVAILLSGVVSALFLVGGTFQSVIAVAAFFFVADYTISFVAVFVLRRREPAAVRPWRARGHPWTTALVTVGSVVFLVSAIASDRGNSLRALALLGLTYPAFVLVRRTRTRRHAVAAPESAVP